MQTTERTAMDMGWGMRMVALDNALRPVEPLLVLAAASLYAGGGWGSFKLAESLAYLLYRLSLMGLDRGIVWRFGNASPEGYRRDLFASIAWVLGASLLGSISLLGISLATVGLVQGMDISYGSLLLISAAIPLLAVADILYQANLNRQEMLARILGKNLALPILTFGGAVLGHVLGGPGLSFWFFLGSLANAIVAAIAFLRRHTVHRGDLLPSLPSAELRRFALPLVGSDLLTGLTSRVDLILLGSLAGIKAVEIYNVVMMIGRSLAAIRQSFEGFLLATFAHEGKQLLSTELRLRLNKAAWVVGSLMGLVLVGVAFWGRDLLSLLDPQYRDGWTALLAMAFLTWLNVSGDLSGVMLQGLGRSREWLLAQAAGFALNIALNLWWIPLWGALGGVLALGVSALLQGLASQFLLWRPQRNLWTGDYLRGYFLYLFTLLPLAATSLLLESPWVRIPLFLAVTAAWLGLYRTRHGAFEAEPALR